MKNAHCHWTWEGDAASAVNSNDAIAITSDRGCLHYSSDKYALSLMELLIRLLVKMSYLQ